MPTEIHVEPTYYDGHSGVCTHGDEEHARVLDLIVIVHGEEDGESGDGDGDGDECEEEAVFREIRGKGNDHRERKRTRPWWNREELCSNGGIAESFYDGGSEEGVAVCGHDHTEIHEAAYDDFVILEYAPDVSSGDFALFGGTALVNLEAGFDVFAFVGGEPFGVFREGGKDEEEADGDYAGENAFEDEDPAPAVVATDSLHFADDGGEEAAKGAGESGGAEEEGVATLRFGAFIPHSNEIKTSWKHSCFEDPKEETGSEEAVVVGYEALGDGDGAKHKHTPRKPDIGVEFLEEDVGGDFEDDVGDEEDGESGVVFDLFEVEIFD